MENEYLNHQLIFDRYLRAGSDIKPSATRDGFVYKQHMSIKDESEDGYNEFFEQRRQARKLRLSAFRKASDDRSEMYKRLPINKESKKNSTKRRFRNLSYDVETGANPACISYIN